MKSTELRIGNQIYLNGAIHKITAADILTISQNEIFGLELPHCNPIKLTEEMLLKSRFKFEYEKMLDRIYSNNSFMLYWNKQNGYRLLFNDKQLGKGISYWHQLQNLCLDITGETLFL